ncbi:ABC transporter substrate-binding protein [Pseudalkalibacillus decolorationis]|uniref:ABC transporter substrate-binding protein n=1 Tax=Pseudalkalibacillus decolorationis TaxID=163879 RepID=UPI002147625D|nr:iron-siderophore ABC transporter substrate-binding protein [Pseudalkalibacillus decolorationis]
MSAITYLTGRKNIFSFLVIILTFVLILTGCSSQEAEKQPNENEGKTGQKEEGVREITHAMGTTKIKGTPKRVVTLYQGATDVAVALGVTPVGVVDSWVEQPMYKYLRDDLEGVKHVGLETQPNLEEIAKLKPDLIIASKLRHEKVYDKLSQIAPTVTHETVFKFKETTELMGKALNKEEKAKELLSDWDNRVADFKEKISEKLGDEWPVEVSVINFRADHARIYITGYAGDILSELGFARPEFQQKEADKGTVVLKLTSKESIPKMNADVFFMFNSDDTEAEAIEKTFKEWTNHPLWKELDAAKKDQTYMVDDVAWNMGGGYISANNMLDQIYDHFELEK